MKRSIACLCLVALADSILTACGGHKTGRTTTQPTPSAPLAVKKGMTKAQVRALAGEAQVAGSDCWLYRFVLKNSGNQLNGSSINGMRSCFTHGRVSLVQTAQHG